jgi:hypothetical protein
VWPYSWLWTTTPSLVRSYSSFSADLTRPLFVRAGSVKLCCVQSLCSAHPSVTAVFSAIIYLLHLQPQLGCHLCLSDAMVLYLTRLLLHVAAGTSELALFFIFKFVLCGGTPDAVQYVCEQTRFVDARC